MVDGLKITRIAIYPISNTEGRLRALCRIVLNDCLQLTNLRIYDGANGLFVSYPIEFTQKGEEFRQIFYPLKKTFREYVEETVLLQYHTEIQRLEHGKEQKEETQAVTESE